MYIFPIAKEYLTTTATTATAKEYLVLLIEKGLIEYVDAERSFKSTEKGMNFLHIHNRVQELKPLTTTLHSKMPIIFIVLYMKTVTAISRILSKAE